MECATLDQFAFVLARVETLTLDLPVFFWWSFPKPHGAIALPLGMEQRRRATELAAKRRKLSITDDVEAPLQETDDENEEEGDEDPWEIHTVDESDAGSTSMPDDGDFWHQFRIVDYW